jgi:hypothetical protein
VLGSIAILFVLACRAMPPRTVHIQGTVRSLGFRTPIAGAQVTVQWPASLGGGESMQRTNASGQYVVQRTIRQREVSCEGIAIAVDAPTYATAYTRYTEADCGSPALTLDFTLYPIPR